MEIKKVGSYNYWVNKSPDQYKDEVISGLKKINSIKNYDQPVTPNRLLEPAIDFYERAQEIDFYGLVKKLPKRYFYYKGYSGDMNEDVLRRILSEMEVVLEDDRGEKVVKVDKDGYYKIGLVMNDYIPRLATNIEELCDGEYMHLIGKKRFKSVVEESFSLMKKYTDDSQWIYTSNILFFLDRLNVIALEARLIQRD
ncbi:hypothetical protein [Vallitalea okinawensis]|uniref:hypothetical protein n=1 Tax=Vallitalea okinawensis TaxID=2078660 RepID=UPI000CFD5FCE|nr:hypothetical protein [Vallitalea okinawensis]